MSEILKRGSRGVEVIKLQQSLNTVYPVLGSPQYQLAAISINLEVDGLFGINTDKWVREFQRRNYLEVDGKVGPITLLALKIPTKALKKNQKIKPKNIILYIHSDDVPGKGTTFTKHKSEMCFHTNFSTHGFVGGIIKTVTDNNYSIKELVINTHGGGGGTISPFDMKTSMKLSHNAMTGLIRKIKPYFTHNCVVTIYACSIASHKVGIEDGPRVYGAGIKEMKVLASTAGIPVIGGFTSQNGTSGNFVGPWVKVNSAGYWTIHKGTYSKWDGAWDDFVRDIDRKIKEEGF